jgi:TRAP transporter TAXI family solute receptor
MQLRPKTRNLRRVFFWAMVGVLVASLGTWYATRDTLPGTIRIAAGKPGGLFWDFAEKLKPRLEKRTGRRVVIVATSGALENRDYLRAGRADMAVLEPSAGPQSDVVSVAPMYEQAVHILVREGGGIRSVNDLRGRSVAVGLSGSGTIADARRVLSHYQVATDQFHPISVHFSELPGKPEVDAAFSTSDYANPDLCRLLKSHAFYLLPVTDAEALAVRYPFYRKTAIPRGLYAENPAVPAADVTTIGVMAYLGTRKDGSDVLVRKTLPAIYEEDLRYAVPELLPLDRAKTWMDVPRHPVAAQYFEPMAGVNLLATFLNIIWATKELMVALIAGLYLLWNRWRRLQEKEEAALLREQKERLDAYLQETMHVEKAQMELEDPAALKQQLDEVTRIKLRALEELTNEKLRDTQAFFVFLMQCSNLNSKIQEKIMLHTGQRRHATVSVASSVPRKQRRKRHPSRTTDAAAAAAATRVSSGSGEIGSVSAAEVHRG